MDTRLYIEYELVNPATADSFTTDSREEAIGYFEKDWIVYEHQVTICRHSKYTQSHLSVTMMWNDNPAFQEN